MIKLTEIGILKRIKDKWPDKSRNDEFGMAEPGGLGFNNVLFPFALLGAGIIAATVNACLEYIGKRLSGVYKDKKPATHN